MTDRYSTFESLAAMHCQHVTPFELDHLEEQANNGTEPLEGQSQGTSEDKVELSYKNSSPPLRLVSLCHQARSSATSSIT